MPQYELNAAGVQQKLSDLYALGDPNLATEATLIRNDVRAWLQVNFFLTPQQQSYISAMNDDFTHFLGDQSSYAVRYRLPINVEFPPAGQPASKLVRTVCNIVPTHSSTGVAVTGDLKVIIFYE